MHSTIWAVLLFIFALLSGIFAFTGAEPGAARELARFFFFLFTLLFVVTTVQTLLASRR